MKRTKVSWFTMFVREELNRYLRDEEPDGEVLEWLNGVPEVKAIRERRSSAAVGTEELEEWRGTGYRTWLIREELGDQVYELSKLGEMLDLPKVADNLVGVVAAQYAALVVSWDGGVDARFEGKVKTLRGLARDVATIHRCVCQSTRLRMESKRRKTAGSGGLGGLGGPDLMGMFREIVERRHEAEGKGGGQDGQDRQDEGGNGEGTGG